MPYPGWVKQYSEYWNFFKVLFDLSIQKFCAVGQGEENLIVLLVLRTHPSSLRGSVILKYEETFKQNIDVTKLHDLVEKENDHLNTNQKNTQHAPQNFRLSLVIGSLDIMFNTDNDVQNSAPANCLENIKWKL